LVEKENLGSKSNLLSFANKTGLYKKSTTDQVRLCENSEWHSLGNSFFYSQLMHHYLVNEMLQNLEFLAQNDTICAVFGH